jgi:hypothetical protein
VLQEGQFSQGKILDHLRTIDASRRNGDLRTQPKSASAKLFWFTEGVLLSGMTYLLFSASMAMLTASFLLRGRSGRTN